MSSLLLESARRLLECSQTLPTELATFQTECQSTRQEAEQLGRRADLVRGQAQQQADSVATAVVASCRRLGEGRSHLQGVATVHQQALASLSQTSQRMGEELLVALGQIVQRCDAVDLTLGTAALDLKKAAEHHRDVTTQGLHEVESAWARLEAALIEAEAAANVLTEGAVQALAGEKSQLAQLTEHLSQTRSNLVRDLDTLCAEGAATEKRFSDRMQQTLALEIGVNAEQIENSTGENLQVGVRQVSLELIERFIEQGVLYMGEQANQSQDLFDPTLHEIEKPIKKYAKGMRLKPMMLAVYNYLLALQQDSLVAAYYPLLFGHPEDV